MSEEKNDNTRIFKEIFKLFDGKKSSEIQAILRSVLEFTSSDSVFHYSSLEYQE